MQSYIFCCQKNNKGVEKLYIIEVRTSNRNSYIKNVEAIIKFSRKKYYILLASRKSEPMPPWAIAPPEQRERERESNFY